LNSTIPLAAGKGTFGFSSYLTTSLCLFKKLIRLNCKQSFFTIYLAFLETQMEMEFDQLDIDSDNDGITDAIEAQGTTLLITHPLIQTMMD
jgi:hypothetical protein